MLIFLDYYSSNQFQFHKGSIKTFLILRSIVFIIDYFNSIKVRLRPFASESVQTNLLFQFHKGSIKTPL